MVGLADVLYPQLCISCHRASRGGLCLDCKEAIDLLDARRCATCGNPGRAARSCPQCRERGFRFDSAVQTVEYSGDIRELIRRYKYKVEWSLGGTLTDFIIESVPRPLADVVTSVPGSANRVRARGFDHSELLARRYASALGLPFVRLIERRLDVKPQAGLPFADRVCNVEGAFFCSMPPPARVIVIDDVYTTGATLNEAARVLKAAGASRVVGAMVARTLPRSARRTYNR